MRRSTYTPRVYPVDERGFSPVDRRNPGSCSRGGMELVAGEMVATVVAGLEITVDCCAQPVNSNAAMAVRRRERVFIFWK